jgi:hypothetical protein
MTLLTRWDPLRDLATMQNRINRLVRDGSTFVYNTDF